ncbi:MAG: hypothetical protein ACRD3F_05425 [Acidobacteriaceae bacterium]
MIAVCSTPDSANGSGWLFLRRINGARRHESFHRRHSAALSAKVVHIRISALGRVPRQERKTLARLAFIEARNISEQNHPPVVGHTLLFAADVTCKTYIPGHHCTPATLPVSDLVAPNTLAQIGPVWREKSAMFVMESGNLHYSPPIQLRTRKSFALELNPDPSAKVIRLLNIGHLVLHGS